MRTRLRLLAAGCVLALVTLATPAKPADAGHFSYSGMIYVCSALRPYGIGSITDAVEIGQHTIYCWWWVTLDGESNCYAYDAVNWAGDWYRRGVHQVADGACF